MADDRMIDAGRRRQGQLDPPQIPPRVQVGRLEMWPLTDLAVAVSVGVATYLLLGPSPDRLSEAVRLTALGYLIVQGSRLLHELGHAIGGQWANRPAQRLVWTALASYCDFQSEAQKRRSEPPAPLPRVAALAGPPVNGAIGLLLLGSFMLFGHSWDADSRELVCLLGWLNVAALGNLLPVPGYDGSYFWARTWNPRPRALAHMPSLALLAALTIGGTSVLTPNGAVRATFSRLDTWVFIVVASIVLALVVQRVLIPRQRSARVVVGSDLAQQ
jgi:hypothetical protein